MKKKHVYSPSRFFCTKCGKEGIPIQRKMASLREKGHLKRLYCIYCGEIVNHVEINDSTGYTQKDFQKEFNAGKFKDGYRI